jgi:hypothetical protein
LAIKTNAHPCEEIKFLRGYKVLTRYVVLADYDRSSDTYNANQDEDCGIWKK